MVKSGQKSQPPLLRHDIDRLLHLLANDASVGSLAAEHTRVASLSPPALDATPQPEVPPGHEDELRIPEQPGSGISDIDWDEFNFPSPQSAIQASSPCATNPEERQQSCATSTRPDISYSLVLHLVDLFFDKIQPWLPLLHKPSFQQTLTDRLDRGPDPLKNFNVEEKLLMYSLFALSSRFSSSPKFSDMDPLDRCTKFVSEAKQIYDQARALTTLNLTYLQGCILLAFSLYTSEPSAQGWILIGVCVRIAYDLGLPEMDDDNCEDILSLGWVRQEEMRRAWWAVWELDTFGSAIHRRPFSIDRRRMIVKLPVSDEAWFSGVEKKSSRLLTRLGSCWKSLQSSDNSDERAWFLVANYLMSLIYDLSQQKEGVLATEKLAMDDEISCLKLSLPSAFNIETEGLTFDGASFGKSNWIIGTHLMLLVASFAASLIGVSDNADLGLSPQNSYHPGAARMRAFELSKIISRWSVEYITVAHPFFSCSILPPSLAWSQHTVSEDFKSSQHLTELVISRFGEKWNLARSVLRKGSNLDFMNTLTRTQAVAKLLHSPTNQSLKDLRIARLFPVYFPYNIRGSNRTSSRDSKNNQNRYTLVEQFEQSGASADTASYHSIDSTAGVESRLRSDSKNAEMGMTPALKSGGTNILSFDLARNTSGHLNDDVSLAFSDIFNFGTTSSV